MSQIRNIFSIKNMALVTLVLQNTTMIVLTRISRTTEGPMFFITTAIASSEVVKFVTCIIILIYENKSVHRMSKIVYEDIIMQPSDIIKLSVPHRSFHSFSDQKFVSSTRKKERLMSSNSYSRIPTSREI